jgi:hypothetical protein
MEEFNKKYKTNKKEERDPIKLAEIKFLTPTERYRLERENKELLEIEPVGTLVGGNCEVS